MTPSQVGIRLFKLSLVIVRMGSAYTPWIDTTGTASLGGYLPSMCTASPNISSWLVRTNQVPEPGTLSLFGLLGLGFLQHRKVSFT